MSRCCVVCVCVWERERGEGESKTAHEESGNHRARLSGSNLFFHEVGVLCVECVCVCVSVSIGV